MVRDFSASHVRLDNNAPLLPHPHNVNQWSVMRWLVIRPDFYARSTKTASSVQWTIIKGLNFGNSPAISVTVPSIFLSGERIQSPNTERTVEIEHNPGKEASEYSYWPYRQPDHQYHQRSTSQKGSCRNVRQQSETHHNNGDFDNARHDPRTGDITTF